MRIESDEGFVSLIADTEVEAKLLVKVEMAFNDDQVARMADGDGPIRRGELRLRVS